MWNKVQIGWPNDNIAHNNYSQKLLQLIVVFMPVKSELKINLIIAIIQSDE